MLPQEHDGGYNAAHAQSITDEKYKLSAQEPWNNWQHGKWLSHGILPCNQAIFLYTCRRQINKLEHWTGNQKKKKVLEWVLHFNEDTMYTMVKMKFKLHTIPTRIFHLFQVFFPRANKCFIFLSYFLQKSYLHVYMFLIFSCCNRK